MKSVFGHLQESHQRPGKLAGIVLVAAAVLLAWSSMAVYAAGTCSNDAAILCDPYGDDSECGGGTCNLPTDCPHNCADIDGSGGAVNLVDFASFAVCFNGSPSSSEACACSDLNGDGSINLVDFASFSLLFNGVSTGVCGPVEYLVSIDGLLFFNNIVIDVSFLVAPEWLNSNDVSLAIEITGINDGFHEHGSQVVLVSDTTVLVIDQGLALVEVDWTTDTNLTHSPEDYTVCVQAMFNGQDFGVPNCRTFGPF